jgi:uncharacterized RDD family membrane protein YckC
VDAGEEEPIAMDEQEHDEPMTGGLASTGQRFANMLLDLVFCCIFTCVFGSALDAIGLQVIQNKANVVEAMILFVYYVSQEAISARTLGKLITGTKVVNEDDTPLNWNGAFLRTICRFIPFDAFSFLGGKGRPRGWHDRISGTKVVSVR